ncbi:putative S-adenosylmethionine-dependent methyltransferase [Spironucleus salmonicida]|uniref:Alpha N-terminal protein methyltransferase 1 n=1 Tax=Spironucleus salmonicida TaxID=348837 RepID=V6LPA9_9EUKA|nr:putative S-adenosylmethionine-dependent methyltransferase [Spironucleus salmonicida]|eukprot:EST45551.1 Methyltransferase [Spironucleus salmonicida]
MQYQNQLLWMKGLQIPSNQEVSYELIVEKMKNSQQYYNISKNHYQCNVSPTIDGMLGGLSYVHEPETQWSVKYLKNILQHYDIVANLCLDVGAGIGRVTEHVLSKIFISVDTVENNQQYSVIQKCTRQKYIQEAQLFLIDQTYDLIWIQWVIGHLTDQDLLQMFKNFAKMTKYIVIKDNLCTQGFMFDSTDANILRNFHLFEDIVKQAGFIIKESEIPDTWPKNLYPIQAILLQRME